MYTSKVWISLILSFGLVVLTIGMLRGESSLSRLWELRDSKAVLKKTISDLSQENSHLQEEIDKIKKSANYARKVLRDKYHITDGDERIVFYAE